MTAMVPSFTIVILMAEILLGIAVPIGLLIFFRKKYKVPIKGFFIGCGVMLFFALILERRIHMVVFGSAIGSAILENIWMYALYGGLMAGIFEETGRLVSMRFLMKKEHNNPYNALMYGAGHGGIEVMVILTIGMLNYMIYAVAINTGQAESLLTPLDEANRVMLQGIFDSLISTAPWHYLLALMERIGALAAQMALSVIVWFAASGKKSRIGLYFLAVVFHLVLDASAVLLKNFGVQDIVIELIVWGIAAVYVMIARRIWLKEKRKK